MALQAWLEAKHARRADLVITVSRYCAERLVELYRVKNAVVVPELIDLDAWRDLFRANPAAPHPSKFTVLSVCRFYPRKRLDVLLQAAALLRKIVPQLEIRIVGSGPAYKRLQRICIELNLEPVVQWLGETPLAKFAEEYNRAHVFCLPSVQEGFGIVFLEAMAAGKPIVAARRRRRPGSRSQRNSRGSGEPGALAEAIVRLYRDRDLCHSLSSAGIRHVEQFEMHCVATRFLLEVAKVAPGIKIAEGIKHTN